MNTLLTAAAVIIVATALYHSALGEKRIITPLMAMDQRAFSKRGRRTIRFTWHLATLLMFLTAATVAWPGIPIGLVRLIGGAYLLLGLVAFYVSRGKHVSGPLFAAAGLMALAGTA